VDVVSPGFSADCLETLEENEMQNRALFMEAGGEHFAYIEALNDRPDHIELMADLVARHGAGWPELDPAWPEDEYRARAQARARRARALGAAR
jgi:ferrochelatase